MTRKSVALVGALCCAVAMAAPAIADSHAEAPAGPSFRPIEIFACNYNDDRSMDDLMQVTGEWNAWMDAEGQSNYWAYMLVPMYYSTDITFDVAWVGGWKNGAEMAASTEFWVTKGGEFQKKFDAVSPCDQHANFAVYDVKRAPNPFQSGPVEFTNCTVEDGRTVSEAVAAVHQWVSYVSEQGVDAGHALLFPAFGESADADYDFKSVTLYSYAEFGEGYDQFGTGGGWRKYEEIFDGLLECDSSRVYHGFPVRKVELGDGARATER